MLFVGRICWGVGVGFGDHCAFIYTAEMAPPKSVIPHLCPCSMKSRTVQGTCKANFLSPIQRCPMPPCTARNHLQ